ncbi:GIY-YIG nuclease family protein [Streptomyces sp. NPDC127051]|uniref:GIY-YIG nuclease family protein n=1 Tax=Streptomyces sp. NPDC127051 TaxID=3347119 RepID=UPI003659CC2D
MDDQYRVVGCLECDWENVLFDDFDAYGECVDRSDSPTRCVALTQAGKRCRLAAESSGRCGKHEDHSAIWERTYNSFRSQWGHVSMPDAYREVFIRAIRDAGLVADAQHVTRDTFEQARRLRHASVVYFVERHGYIKIGVTSSLKQRLPSLASGSCLMPDGVSPGPVTLLATTPGDREVEAAYHLRFRRLRVRGEWFRPNKALLTVVEDLQRAARNDRKDILDQALSAMQAA